MDLDQAGPVRAVRDAFAAYPGRWWIAGGWAVDLHVGRVRRAHSDIDVLILHQDLATFGEFFASRGLVIRDQQSGQVRPWRHPDEVIPGRNTFSFSEAARPDGYDIEIVVGLADGEDWLFHRGRKLRRRLAAMTHLRDGIPYLGPEIVLLFKARDGRDKDDADFADLLPLLTIEQKQWLAPRLAPPGRPDHRWLAALTSSVSEEQ